MRHINDSLENAPKTRVVTERIRSRLGGEHDRRQQHQGTKQQADQHVASAQLHLHSEGQPGRIPRGISAHAALLTAAVLSVSCATAASRPTLLDLPPGPPLTETSPLVDGDPDERVVDVRIEATPAVISLLPADALVVRVPPAPTPRTLTLDGDVADSVTTSTHAESTWLLAPQRARAYAIRATAEPTRIEALVVVQAGDRRERILLLDDTTDGVKRQDGLGNVVLVNGQRRPTLAVARGAKERWHFANTSVARTFVLALPGHVFSVVDGEPAGEMTLGPGAIASVDVELGSDAAASFDLVTLDGAVGASGEAWPLIHVVTTAPLKEDS